MAKETKNMRAPLTLDGSGDPGEMTFASDQAAPFATTDPNVWQIAPVDKSEEIEEYWQFMGGGSPAPVRRIRPSIACCGFTTPLAKSSTRRQRSVLSVPMS